jgi:hypothetical protein
LRLPKSIVLIDGSQAYEPRIDQIEWRLLAGGSPLARKLILQAGNLRNSLPVSYAVSGVVELKLTVHNPRPPNTRGLWDLGDPGSIRFKEPLGTRLCTRQAAGWAAQPQEFVAAIEGTRVEIYQT